MTIFNILARHIEVCQYLFIRKVSPCCSPVLQGSLSKEDAEELASLFKALGDPARLRLLSFIAERPEGEACVCFLTEPTGLSQPTVSHHLKLLHDAALLEREKRGAWVFYRVIPERLEAIRAALVTRIPRPREAKRA